MTLSAKDLKALAAHRLKHGTSEGFVPSPPKKRNNPEMVMHMALVRWWAENCKRFEVPEFLLWHTQNGMVYSGTKADRERAGGIARKMAVRAGVPDIFLAWPRDAHDRNQGRSDNECYANWLPAQHGLFVELKTAKGIVSPEQTAILQALEAQGYATAICRTLEDAQKVIQDYLT